MKQIEENRFPIIELESISIVDNIAIYKNETFDVPTLIQYCKEQNYPIFEAPLSAMKLSDMPWSKIDDLYDFCYQMNRVNECSLDYPIILAPNGQVLDGTHRICKAVIRGDNTIKCIRIQNMPKASGKAEFSN